MDMNFETLYPRHDLLIELGLVENGHRQPGRTRRQRAWFAAAAP